MGCGCHGKDDHSGEEATQGSDLEIAFEAFRPDPDAIERAAQVLSAHRGLTERLAGAEHRLLSLRVTDEEGAGKRQAPCPPDSVTATVDAHLDRFMTPPEPVTDTDVVLWYSAHFTHDQAHESGAKVGPELVPSGW